MPTVNEARAKLAGLTRHHHSPEVLEQARRDLRAANAEAYVRKLAAAGLTADERTHLAGLLDPAERGAAA